MSHVERDSQRMNNIISTMNNGDHVSTDDLTWFIKNAEATIDLLSAVPAYALVVTDLITKRNAARSSIDFRRSLHPTYAQV